MREIVKRGLLRMRRSVRREGEKRAIARSAHVQIAGALPAHAQFCPLRKRGVTFWKVRVRSQSALCSLLGRLRLCGAPRVRIAARSPGSAVRYGRDSRSGAVTSCSAVRAGSVRRRCGCVQRVRGGEELRRADGRDWGGRGECGCGVNAVFAAGCAELC